VTVARDTVAADGLLSLPCLAKLAPLISPSSNVLSLPLAIANGLVILSCSS
jgi:hypothetical protein